MEKKQVLAHPIERKTMTTSETGSTDSQAKQSEAGEVGAGVGAGVASPSSTSAPTDRITNLENQMIVLAENVSLIGQAVSKLASQPTQPQMIAPKGNDGVQGAEYIPLLMKMLGGGGGESTMDTQLKELTLGSLRLALESQKESIDFTRSIKDAIKSRIANVVADDMFHSKPK